MRNPKPIGISKASQITGIEVHTIRYWEECFGLYLNPLRTPGRQRRYREEDINRLVYIKLLLKDEMYSIAGVQRLIERDVARRVEVVTTTQLGG